MSNKHLEENLKKAYFRELQRKQEQQDHALLPDSHHEPMKVRDEKEIKGRISLKDLEQMLKEAEALEGENSLSEEDRDQLE